MTDFAELKEKIIRLIGDEVVNPTSGDDTPLHGSQTSAETLADAVEAALKEICNRFPKSASISYTNGLSFPLPLDFIEVEAIYDTKSTLYLPQVQFYAQRSPYGEPNLAGNGWLLFAVPGSTPWEDENGGTLSLLSAIAADQHIDVYYAAYWAIPENDDDALEVPESTITALSLYGASYCMLRSASEAGGLAQYKTKVDSGNPTDNPLIDLSDFFLKRYENALSKLPPRSVGVK